MTFRRMCRSRASFRHALARDPSLAPAALNLGKALHFRIVAERDTPGKNSQAKVVVRELREAVHWFDRAVRRIPLCRSGCCQACRWSSLCF